MIGFKKKETHTILSNFFSLTILQVANYILPLIILPFLVRVLDLENFGIVMFSQALITFIVIAVDFGFDISGTREISISNTDKVSTSLFLYKPTPWRTTFYFSLSILNINIFSSIVHFLKYD